MHEAELKFLKILIEKEIKKQEEEKEKKTKKN